MNKLPGGSDFRIVKKFNGVWCFGTATPNNGIGDYEFDVRYDDGDFEHFNRTELERAKQKYSELAETDPRGQKGFGAERSIR